jgi:hypothetical protein
MNDDRAVEILADIRKWVRAASYASVKELLESTLPDSKSRAAYQMLDGSATIEQVRVACKMSPNALVALAQKCISSGLMEAREDKKRVRLFDLTDFGMLGDIEEPNAGTRP